MKRKKKPLVRKKTNKPLSAQLKARVQKPFSVKKEGYEGNTETMISTGSTLLDLAISGGRKRGGGIPGGILLEAFGPNGSGKTVVLCEIAGAIQRLGGDVQFNDPEARLNKQFAKMFDFDTDNIEINEPDTVTEVFDALRKWEPKGKAEVSGVLTDSLAALSTDMEMEKEEGDKLGMRRAKEFSEGLRKACRLIKKNNYIMACSNQIRENAGGTTYGEKFTVPGGKAIGFYSSIRLRFHTPEKIRKSRTIGGKEVKKVIGVKTKVEVYKNSCDAPYRTADLYILFDYGVDDIRANLQYLKDYSKNTMYCIEEVQLSKSLDDAVRIVEQGQLEDDLRVAVRDLWEEIEDKFKVERKKKRRE